MSGEFVESPTFAHFGMYEVLVDGGEFNGETCVEALDDLRITFHNYNLSAEAVFNKIRISQIRSRALAVAEFGDVSASRAKRTGSALGGKAGQYALDSAGAGPATGAGKS